MIEQNQRKSNRRTEVKNKLKYSDKTSKNYGKYNPSLENKITLIYHRLFVKLKKCYRYILPKRIH